jgi:hypothetical protein
VQKTRLNTFESDSHPTPQQLEVTKIDEETDPNSSLDVMPFQDDESQSDLRMPAKSNNATVSFGEIVQSALCVAKVGLAKLSCKKAGNCSVSIEHLFEMLKHSSKKAIVVFKEKFSEDILALETDFEYAHSCFSLLLAEFTSSLTVSEAVNKSSNRLLA